MEAYTSDRHVLMYNALTNHNWNQIEAYPRVPDLFKFYTYY